MVVEQDRDSHVLEKMESFISMGFDVNVRGPGGMTPLYAIFRSKDSEYRSLKLDRLLASRS